MSLRFVLAAVVVVSGMTGCDAPTLCTLVGCSSAIVVEAPTLNDAAFSVVVETDTVSGSVSCAAADADGERGAPTETSGDIGREEQQGATIGATCDARGITLRVLVRDETGVLPTRATVTITSGAATFTAAADPIVYDVTQPNGPDCEPTCSFARIFTTSE